MTEMVATVMAAMFSVLVPAKMWYAPDQPLEIEIEADEEVTLVLRSFTGGEIEPSGDPDVGPDETVDLREVFQQLTFAGTYLLYAVPRDGEVDDFLGTPLVIGVREDDRPGAPPGPMVVRVEPLRYAVMQTDQGEMTMAFYFDVAPNTAAHFLRLAEQGYYDGLTFHRIVPQFVIQGGDPRGDGSGGPGYTIEAEFNERPHVEGVLSMARQGDPNEATGVMPRPQFANSAGSQFFVCLDYERTRQLDRRYTAFGQVVEGMDAVHDIAASPIADPRTGRPETPTVIQSVQVRPVTAEENPYADLLNLLREGPPEAIPEN